MVVTGLALAAAQSGIEVPDAATAARADAVGLVQLLYTALTGTWPGEEPLAAGVPLVEALDLPALVERADDVAIVQAISSESHFDDQGRIVTDTRMQVEQSEKGSRVPGSVVVVRAEQHPLGEVGVAAA